MPLWHAVAPRFLQKAFRTRPKAPPARRRIGALGLLQPVSTQDPNGNRCVGARAHKSEKAAQLEDDSESGDRADARGELPVEDKLQPEPVDGPCHNTDSARDNASVQNSEAAAEESAGGSDPLPAPDGSLDEEDTVVTGTTLSPAKPLLEDRPSMATAPPEAIDGDTASAAGAPPEGPSEAQLASELVDSSPVEEAVGDEEGRNGQPAGDGDVDGGGDEEEEEEEQKDATNGQKALVAHTRQQASGLPGSAQQRRSQEPEDGAAAAGEPQVGRYDQFAKAAELPAMEEHSGRGKAEDGLSHVQQRPHSRPLQQPSLPEHAHLPQPGPASTDGGAEAAVAGPVSRQLPSGIEAGASARPPPVSDEDGTRSAASDAGSEHGAPTTGVPGTAEAGTTALASDEASRPVPPTTTNSAPASPAAVALAATAALTAVSAATAPVATDRRRVPVSQPSTAPLPAAAAPPASPRSTTPSVAPTLPTRHPAVPPPVPPPPQRSATPPPHPPPADASKLVMAGGSAGQKGSRQQAASSPSTGKGEDVRAAKSMINPFHLTILAILLFGGVLFTISVVNFTTDMGWMWSSIKVLRKLTKSLAFRQSIALVVAIMFVRFGLEPLVRAVRSVFSLPGPWDRSLECFILQQVYKPLEFLLFIAAISTIMEAVLPPLVSLQKETVRQVVRTTLSLTYVILSATVVFNIKNRLMKSRIWDAELAGDTSAQRSIEVSDKLFTLLLLLVAFLLGLQSIGLDIQSLLAISGFGGLALGLAGREILENLFNGLVILSSRSFDVGEEIMFTQSGHAGRVIEGIIMDIGWYRTLIRSFEREVYVVPNSVFSRTVVLNVTRKGKEWRVFENLYICPEDAPAVPAIIADLRKTIRQDKRVMPKLHRRVFWDKITRDALLIHVSFYVEAANRDAFMACKQDLFAQFALSCKRHGARLAANRHQVEIVRGEAAFSAGASMAPLLGSTIEQGRDQGRLTAAHSVVDGAPNDSMDDDGCRW